MLMLHFDNKLSTTLSYLLVLFFCALVDPLNITCRYQQLYNFQELLLLIAVMPDSRSYLNRPRGYSPWSIRRKIKKAADEFRRTLERDLRACKDSRQSYDVYVALPELYSIQESTCTSTSSALPSTSQLDIPVYERDTRTRLPFAQQTDAHLRDSSAPTQVDAVRTPGEKFKLYAYFCR